LTENLSELQCSSCGLAELWYDEKYSDNEPVECKSCRSAHSVEAIALFNNCEECEIEW